MIDTKTQHFRRPAVEIAAMRNMMVLRRQQQGQKFFNFLTLIATGIVLYFFADIDWFVLALVLLTGIISGSAFKDLRAYGEWYRFMSSVKDSMEQSELQTFQSNLRSSSRAVFTKIVFALICLAGIALWILFDQGNLLVVLPCIILLTYLRSSIKPIAGDPETFLELTPPIQEDSCRIVLFRTFDRSTSSLARSALAPILTGYGHVDIVLDDTFAHAESEGIFGKEASNLDVLCKVHRCENEAWKECVVKIIRECDIAVVDITFTTPGVIWELAQCYNRLPPYRVYCIINGGAIEKDTLANYMSEFYKSLGENPEMPKNVRPYVFIFIPNAWQQETLASDIHRKMLDIIEFEDNKKDSGYMYSDIQEEESAENK